MDTRKVACHCDSLVVSFPYECKECGQISLPLPEPKMHDHQLNDPSVPEAPVERLLRRHGQICWDAQALMKRKNHDYARGEKGNPYANFEMADNLGVCSTEAGIVLRMGDKLQRLATFATEGKLKVAKETTLDAVHDLINYAILLQTYIEDHK